MTEMLGVAVLLGLPMILGALIGFSKGYWQGYRDGFNGCLKAKEQADG